MTYDAATPVQGAMGTNLLIEFLNADGTVRDISGADSLEIHLKPPDGSLVILPAQVYTDGTDGLASHVDQAGLFAEFGCFRIWGFEYRGFAVFPTEVGTFQVQAAPPAPLTTALLPAPVATLATLTVSAIT